MRRLELERGCGGTLHTSLLSLHGLTWLGFSLDHLPRSGIVHDVLGLHISIISHENASQANRMKTLFSNNYSYVKLIRTNGPT